MKSCQRFTHCCVVFAHVFLSVPTLCLHYAAKENPALFIRSSLFTAALMPHTNLYYNTYFPPLDPFTPSSLKHDLLSHKINNHIVECAVSAKDIIKEDSQRCVTKLTILPTSYSSLSTSLNRISTNQEEKYANENKRRGVAVSLQDPTDNWNEWIVQWRKKTERSRRFNAGIK